MQQHIESFIRMKMPPTHDIYDHRKYPLLGGKNAQIQYSVLKKRATSNSRTSFCESGEMKMVH